MINDGMIEGSSETSWPCNRLNDTFIIIECWRWCRRRAYVVDVCCVSGRHFFVKKKKTSLYQLFLFLLSWCHLQWHSYVTFLLMTKLGSRERLTITGGGKTGCVWKWTREMAREIMAPATELHYWVAKRVEFLDHWSAKEEDWKFLGMEWVERGRF